MIVKIYIVEFGKNFIFAVGMVVAGQILWLLLKVATKLQTWFEKNHWCKWSWTQKKLFFALIWCFLMAIGLTMYYSGQRSWRGNE